MAKNTKPKVEKTISTYQYRIKDSNEKLVKSLFLQSGSVNFVWNYCNRTQQEAVNRKRKWLSGFDLSNLTAGASKELNLHSQTVQAICEEYATRRYQFNKPYLNFRTNKKNRNLPWIPFKSSAIKVDDKGTFSFMGLKLKTFYSRKLPNNAVIKTGNICCDNTGKWFINVTFELKFENQEALDEYKLSLTSKGQNLTAIDPGLNPMLTFSIENPDGTIEYKEIEPQRFFKNSQEKLAIAQRANKKKQVRNIHKRIANQRKDFQHKLALELVRNNHTIVNTSLSYKQLIQSKLKGHSKAWSDCGQGYFRTILKTKARKHNTKYAEMSERILVSTQTCSHCKALTGPRGRKGLSVSAWDCTKCGRHHLRNQNSADNHRLAYKDALAKELAKSGTKE
jgi:transposase